MQKSHDKLAVNFGIIYSMPFKVVYNAYYGGFSLSYLAAVWLASKGHDGAVKFLATAQFGDTFYCYMSRHSSLLISCIEELGLPAVGGSYYHRSRRSIHH